MHVLDVSFHSVITFADIPRSIDLSNYVDFSFNRIAFLRSEGFFFSFRSVNWRTIESNVVEGSCQALSNVE